MDDLRSAEVLRTARFGEPGHSRLQLPAKKVAALLRGFQGGLVFTNVDVQGDLELQETDVVAFARFVNSSFFGVRVERATFRRSLVFSGCRIGRFRGHHTHFDDLRITGGEMREFIAGNSAFDKSCVIRRVQTSRIILPASRIAGNLRIKDLTADEVDLSRLSIDGICDLRKLETRKLDLEGLSAQRLDASGARVTNATMNRVIVKDEMDLSDMRVADTLDLRSAEIGDDIYLNRSRLHDVDMSGTKSGDALFIEESVIYGDLTIIEGRFGYLICNSKICGSIYISGVSFAAVHLACTRFESDFVFARNTVSGDVEVLSLEKIRPTVRGECVIASCRVGGPVVFTDLQVGGDLSLASLTTTELWCGGLSLAKNLFLSGLTASHRIRLESSKVHHDVKADSLTAMTVEILRCNIRSLVLTSAEVKGSTKLSRVKVDKLITAHAVFGADLAIRRVQVASVLDMTRSRVGDLRFENQMVDGEGRFRFPARTTLKDCDYDSIRVSWRDLVQALDSDAEYDATAYRIFENYVRTLGRADWADQIYLNSKRHATRKLPRGWKRNGEEVLDWISGYGARPRRLLRVVACIYAIMWVVVFVLDAQNAAFLKFSAHDPLGAIVQISISAVDVVLRGDKSGALVRLAAEHRSWPQVLVDAALALRYVIGAALGLLAAYVTGLIRYTASGNRS